MPELPEVEHVVRALRGTIVGRRILAAQLKLKRIAPGISLKAFDKQLRDAQVVTVARRGKYILIELNSGCTLVTHLRMTGKFLSVHAEDPLPPYAHVVFHLDDETRLVFCDMRQFGRMTIVKRNGALKELLHLAPEPLSDQFSVEYLQNVLRRSKRSMKQLLLDQTRVLGLGNIYAAEVLFLAGINPLKEANSLSRRRSVRLHAAIRQILAEAIESGSTLRIDLADGNASYFGSSERFWRVYEREMEPCVNCGTKIRRIVHGGRSTYYCPRCQSH
ncbi:MAG: bifunctional DNA-formamidopyrimidine glycosylase/DNA-(apurinic or apyrimidinic site) lyase [Pyrinomonadaceae bacterium]